MSKLPQVRRVNIGEKDILALSFAGLCLMFFALAGSSYLSARSCSRLAKGADTVFVQQPDGTAFVANPKSPNYREPLVVRNYVSKWLTYTFSLSNNLTTKTDSKVVDRGIYIDGQQIPTNVVSGAYALAANKREKFVSAYVAEGWIPEDYFSGDSTTQLEIDELGKARLIDEEKQIYAVNVVATVSHLRNGQPTGKVDFYRRKIIVAPIPIPQYPPAQNASIYQKLSYQWKKEGLQIKDIEFLSFDL
ncbi:hypothetical protein [Myxosarcina sp. GI1]|uniref:hypothetical protein n=1 Tax=Myxosarcina sp. GI1 TaxID=1541065 RepID=UPI0005619CFC|nr:hypothetical protein [Myxosarcina sp. GI1]